MRRCAGTRLGKLLQNGRTRPQLPANSPEPPHRQPRTLVRRRHRHRDIDELVATQFLDIPADEEPAQAVTDEMDAACTGEHPDQPHPFGQLVTELGNVVAQR